MAYNNTYNRPNYGPPQRQYSNAPRQQSRRDEITKKSGCIYTTGRNGKPTVSAWNKSKSGLLKIVAQPRYEGGIFSKDKVMTYTSAAGKVWQKWIVSVTFATRQKQTSTGFYDTTTQRLFIPDIDMMACHNTRFGGRTAGGKSVTGYLMGVGRKR